MHKLDQERMILEADHQGLLIGIQCGASLRVHALSLVAPARFRLDRITPERASRLQDQVKAFAARLSQWEADIDTEGVRAQYLPLIKKMRATRKRAQTLLDARTVANLSAK